METQTDMLKETMKLIYLGLSTEQKEWFEERAGILEFEAGMSRGEAESLAIRLAAAEFGLGSLVKE